MPIKDNQRNQRKPPSQKRIYSAWKEKKRKIRANETLARRNNMLTGGVARKLFADDDVSDPKSDGPPCIKTSYHKHKQLEQARIVLKILQKLIESRNKSTAV